MHIWTMLMAAAATMLAAPAAAPTEVTVQGPSGTLAGTLIDPGAAVPAILIIPGSGPTNRDGDNPLGVKAAPYRLLAEALANRGVATLRADKRGLFGSKAAGGPDPNAATFADYAADAHAWVNWWRGRTNRRCIWLLGHSEGGSVALMAAQHSDGICGVLLVEAAGRPLDIVMRSQFAAAPADAPARGAALAMLDAIRVGRTVDPATLPVGLGRLFPLPVQRYLISVSAIDPAKLAASIRLPMLIVRGTHDLQIGLTDTDALTAAAPSAKLVVLPGMNHVLKVVADDPRANRASYADPSLPIAPALVDTVAAFVEEKR